MLFYCCLPDLVAFLPDEHKVINISSSCSDHWTFGSCHHSVCVLSFLPEMGQPVSNSKGQISSVASRVPSALQKCGCTTPYDAFFNIMISPGDTFRAAASPSTGNARDLDEVCVLARMLHRRLPWRQQKPIHAPNCNNNCLAFLVMVGDAAGLFS